MRCSTGSGAAGSGRGSSAAAIQVLWLAAAWIGLQLLVGLASFQGGSIATAAHVGGFLAGLALAKPLLRFPLAQSLKVRG
jgi:membrane associated rhomboid family serine protease